MNHYQIVKQIKEQDYDCIMIDCHECPFALGNCDSLFFKDMVDNYLMRIRTKKLERIANESLSDS